MLLAIDAGTSSARAALFDREGHRVAGSLAQREYAVRTARSGMAVFAAGPWLAAVRRCVHEASEGEQLEGVGMSCFWHGLLGIDAEGRALTPIYTWADSRCRADAAALRRAFDERDVHAETGCMLRASFWPAKLRWLRRTEPALFRRVKKWISPAEWLQWRVTGAATCAIGMATGTGLFDPRALRWSGRLLEACGIDAGRLLTVSDEPGEWRGAPWFPGIGDGAAGNLGCGAVGPDAAAINLGTSAALRVMRTGRRAQAPFGLFCYRVDARRFLVGGAVSNAGNLHAWSERELKLPPDHAFPATPDHGLTVLPFWTAERAPRWNEDDAGTIHGLRQSTTAAEIQQALAEAAYYRLAGIAERLAPRRGSAPRWIVSGGGGRSRSELQRLANIIGAPVFSSSEPEASLRGAAVLVVERLGDSRRRRPRPPFSAESKIHARYREARAAQSRLELALGGSAQ